MRKAKLKEINEDKYNIGDIVVPIGYSDEYSFKIVRTDKHGRLWSDRGTFMHCSEVKMIDTDSGEGKINE